MPIFAAPDRPCLPTPTHSTDWVVEQTFRLIQESWRILAASHEVDHWPRFNRAAHGEAGDEPPPHP